MFNILLDQLESTVQNEILDNLNNYFHHNQYIYPQFKSKWLIYSDYSMDNNSNKPNHVITYIIIPYAFENELDKLIGKELTKDLKHIKIKSVKPYFSQLLNSGLIFSISFILEKNRVILGTNQDEKKNNLKNWLAEIEECLLEKDKYKETIKKINVIRNKQNSSNYNYSLLEDIFLVSFLSGYVAFLIKKNCSETKIMGWFSDRDDKLTKEDNICTDLFYLFYIFICNYSGIAIDPSEKIYYGVPEPSNKMWYDNLNRIPDYIAGSFADLKLNDIHPINNKFTTIMYKAIAENKFVHAVKVHLRKQEIQVSSIEVNKDISFEQWQELTQKDDTVRSPVG